MPKKLVLVILTLSLLVVACQPRTVIIRPGENVPESKGMQPIYITATPSIPRGTRNWTYDNAREDGMIRFTDKVDGHLIVCYYHYRLGDMQCLELSQGVEE